VVVAVEIQAMQLQEVQVVVVQEQLEILVRLVLQGKVTLEAMVLTPQLVLAVAVEVLVQLVM
jgi:hypothetical protein